MASTLDLDLAILFPCGYSSPSSDYVARYVPDGIGSKFNPHVSIGIATQAYLDRTLDEGFEPFTFSPVEVAVYHLGNLGTARKRLMSWELTA